MVELEIAKFFIVRGEPEQVAMTVYALLEMMRVRHDMEAEKTAKKELEIMEKLGGISLEELLRAEQAVNGEKKRGEEKKT